MRAIWTSRPNRVSKALRPLAARGARRDDGALSLTGWTTGGRARAGAASARLTAALATLALCGCVETGAQLAPSPEAHRQFVLRQGADLPQASVAIVSIEGAPSAVAARFSQALAREARARDIAVVDAAQARYLVRGYLSAASIEDGAAIDYVWDLFTADKRRAQRLSDEIAVKGSGDDPWALADEAALKSVAARSADDLAAYLSNTPEAAAVASAPPAAETTAAAPLSYAPM
jgi:hypothetical protein